MKYCFERIKRLTADLNVGGSSPSKRTKFNKCILIYL
jgi:hypothetical protein